MKALPRVACCWQGGLAAEPGVTLWEGSTARLLAQQNPGTKAPLGAAVIASSPEIPPSSERVL